MRILVDVDGVVADLMGGFERFFLEETGRRIDTRKSTTHRMSRAPEFIDLHREIDLDDMLHRFLSVPDVYQNYVELIPDAHESIEYLLDEGHVLGFVTATLWSAPCSFESKFDWLNSIFPYVPMLSVGSAEKHWVTGDYAIDDRYDTCTRWENAGVRPLMFRQPWNEAPAGTPSYDWRGIVAEIARSNAAK